jgi:hypothetical protein
MNLYVEQYKLISSTKIQLWFLDRIQKPILEQYASTITVGLRDMYQLSPSTFHTRYPTTSTTPSKPSTTALVDEIGDQYDGSVKMKDLVVLCRWSASVSYICWVLQEWTESVFFLHLQSKRQHATTTHETHEPFSTNTDKNNQSPKDTTNNNITDENNRTEESLMTTNTSKNEETNLLESAFDSILVIYKKLEGKIEDAVVSALEEGMRETRQPFRRSGWLLQSPSIRSPTAQATADESSTQYLATQRTDDGMNNQQDGMKKKKKDHRTDERERKDKGKCENGVSVEEAVLTSWLHQRIQLLKANLPVSHSKRRQTVFQRIVERVTET